ncbi:hypothetical protein [Streptomyces sp. NBC_00470]|uniref:hypothetical protein n=1 Tax=Streptomyces sp. NBC_00470 TaxID=2975753 RepID=UPI0030DE9FA8
MTTAVTRPHTVTSPAYPTKGEPAMHLAYERKPLSERLKDAGCPGELVYNPTEGRQLVRMPDGEELTPGKAADRYRIPVL